MANINETLRVGTHKQLDIKSKHLCVPKKMLMITALRDEYGDRPTTIGEDGTITAEYPDPDHDWEARREREGTKRYNIEIPDEIHDNIRIISGITGIPIKELVERAIEKHYGDDTLEDVTDDLFAGSTEA